MNKHPDTDSDRTGNDNPPSPRTRSGLRRWLLLYRPSRRRAWLYWLPFYFLAFLIIPLLSIAALGAYMGPDETPAGIPAVLFILFLAIIVRRRALRANAMLPRSRAVGTWHRISESWPFPLEDPPPRRVFYGYLMSASGTALILIGLCGLGLAGNGLAWQLLLLSGVETGMGETPPLPLVIALGIAAMVTGVLIGFAAVPTGRRLLDRGRRLRARDARILLQRAGEQPVLLLRSFADEELVDPRPVSFLQRRYEENLVRALKQLGPVITVGRPGDSMGFSGAARFYVSADNWQHAVRYLISHAAAVVIVVGRTEGIWWEIAAAFESVPRERLLFFFPLADPGTPDHSLLGGFREFSKRWNLTGRTYRKLEAERRARYQLFRQRTARYLETSLPADLGNAFFLDFLPDGQVRLLRSRYGYLRNFMADLIPRYRRLRFSMARTLWPFMAKLYEAG